MKPECETMTNRFKTAMKSLLEGTKSCPDYSLIIETDFEHEKYWAKLDEKVPNMNGCNDSSELFDSKTVENIQTELEAAIKEAAEKKINCHIIYPSDLVYRIAKDILHMSIAEPCGVRGGVIYIVLQEKDRSLKLATIFGKPSTLPTFEIHLTLKEDDRCWRKFQKIYYTIKGCILNSQWTSLPKLLCSAYQLEKRKLYRSSHKVDSRNTNIQ